MARHGHRNWYHLCIELTLGDDVKPTTSTRSRRRRAVARGALASKPRLVRATVQRYAPTRAELRRQFKAAARADRGDDWADYIDWSVLR